MRAPTRWWLLFGTGTLTVLLATAWTTSVAVRLDRAEQRARGEAAYQEAVRLSLWRMDSWLAPRLAPEAGRTYFEYLPYFAQERAYTRLLSTIETGEVLTPSPLLTFENEYFSLHFQVGTDGIVTSPQVPSGNLRNLAESTLVSGERIDRKRRLLEEVETLVGATMLGQRVVAAEACVIMTPPAEPPAPELQPYAPPTQQQEAMTKLEWSKRAQSPGQVTVAGAEMLNRLQQVDQNALGSTLTVGPLVPLWLQQADAEPTLIYLRRVLVNGGELLQGFLVDWRRLHESLLMQVEDLFANAHLEPAALETLATDPAPTALTTLPAALRATRSDVTEATTGLTPLRLTLAITWVVVLAAIAAAAMSLRASIAYGERRSRFASAVTHELRTPLTTFRMYSEMLADGIVRDEDSRQTYLETLKREAQRLASLVENVLAYARLERGSATADRQRLQVHELLERVGPRLQERAAGAGLDLQRQEDVPPDTEVDVDVEAVGQILFNLVDNACKYAGDKPLQLASRLDDDRLVVAVRDGGPGVPPREAGHIFRPFERGRTNGANHAPGIGLGLSLSRGLARDLGGDLRLAESSAEGACFELRLPIA